MRDLPDIESLLLFNRESNIHVTTTFVASSLIQEGRVICISSQWSDIKGRYTITKEMCSINSYPTFLNDDTVYTFKGQTLKGDVILRPILSQDDMERSWQDLHDSNMFSRGYVQAGVIYPTISRSPVADIGTPLFYKYTFRSNQPDEWRVLRPLLSRNADLHSMSAFVCPWLCWPGSFFDTEKLSVESVHFDLLQLSEKVIASLREHYETPSHQYNDNYSSSNNDNNNNNNNNNNSRVGDDTTRDRSSLCIKRVILDFVAEFYPTGHPRFRLLHVAKIDFSSRITFPQDSITSLTDENSRKHNDGDGGRLCSDQTVPTGCSEMLGDVDLLLDPPTRIMTTPPPIHPIVSDIFDTPLTVDDDLAQRLLESHDIVGMVPEQETWHNTSIASKEHILLQQAAINVTFAGDDAITSEAMAGRSKDTSPVTAQESTAGDETERKRKILRDTLLGFTARRLRQRNICDDCDDTTGRSAADGNPGATYTPSSGMSERIMHSDIANGAYNEDEIVQVQGGDILCEKATMAEKEASIEALADSWLYLCTVPSSIARGDGDGDDEAVDKSNDDNNEGSHYILTDDMVSEEELLEYDRQSSVKINQPNTPIPRMTTYNASAQMCITELFAHFDRKLDDRLAQRRAQRLAATTANTIKDGSSDGNENKNGGDVTVITTILSQPADVNPYHLTSNCFTLLQTRLKTCRPM